MPSAHLKNRIVWSFAIEYDFLIYFDCEDLYENEDYTTVAGLCLSSLDRIPKEGDGFEWHSFMFEVTDMDGVRIDKVLVSRKQ